MPRSSFRKFFKILVKEFLGSLDFAGPGEEKKAGDPGGIQKGRQWAGRESSIVQYMFWKGLFHAVLHFNIGYEAQS